MTTIQTILDFLNDYCPFELAMEWDNAGLNVGRRETEVSRILLALDVTEEVINVGASAGCELILTHHPLLFDPLRQVTADTAEGRRILSLSEKRIAHIACHTNLDAAEGGVNTLLAAACGMKDSVLFGELGRIGKSQTTLTELVAQLKAALPACTCIGVRDHEEVRRIAVVGGSGGSLLEEAIAEGCDTFVTGEAKHSHALLAEEQHVNLLLLGHYETEYLALAPLANALRKAFPDLTVELMPQRAPMETL